MGVAEVLELLEEEIRELSQEIRSERNKEMRLKLRGCLVKMTARYKGLLEIARKESRGVKHHDLQGNFIDALFEEEPEKPKLMIPIQEEIASEST